jgi:hypothetical protein
MSGSIPDPGSIQGRRMEDSCPSGSGAESRPLPTHDGSRHDAGETALRQPNGAFRLLEYSAILADAFRMIPTARIGRAYIGGTPVPQEQIEAANEILRAREHGDPAR